MRVMGKMAARKGEALVEDWGNHAPGEKKLAFGVRKEAIYMCHL